MSEQNGIKSFEDKVHTQLQEAKSQLEKLESAAKGKMAQVEVDALNQLKTRRQEIENKRQELKTAAAAKAAQLKTEIESDVAKFKESLHQLHAKFNAHTAAK